MTAFALSALSISRLDGVHPKLVSVVKRAIELTSVDFLVVQGVRSKEQALINYGKGRTAAELAAKHIDENYAQPSLAKVTWVANPLGTKHLIQADGYGHAVDLAPVAKGGGPDWSETKENYARFDAIADAMKQAAVEQGVKIRCGTDFVTSKDRPHFELTA